MKDFKKLFLILGVIVAVIVAYGVINSKSTENVSKKPIVAVSSFALYDIVAHVARDSIKLVNILPFGVDAHSFEPTPKLMAFLEKSDLIFYSGAGLEPWIDGFVFKGKAVDMSHFVSLRKLSHHHHNGKAHQTDLDPHYWLDVENMKKATQVVMEALVILEPMKKKFYEQNAKQYIQMLKRLDSSYKKGLFSCKKDIIITNHNAFSYLAARYGFHVEAVSGLSPEAQPNAKKIAQLMQDIKKDGLKTIFFESFVSDRVIKTIAKDSGISIDSLQPLGNITKDEADQGLDYEKIMRKNLLKLEKALECH